MAGTSLPQGDPWAMLATAVVLLAPLYDLKRNFPTVKATIYVDDRNRVANTAQECIDYGDAWCQLSACLGLKENDDKA